MQEYPFVSFLGVTLYYWCGGLDLCCLFLLHEKSVIPMMLSMFSGRRGQWVGPAFRAWSLGSQQKQRPVGRRHRLLLFTGPWEAVMSSKVSSRWPENLAVAAAGCVSSQGCENINSLCLIAVSSSEMIGMSGGACSGIPSGSGPWPSSFSGNCVGLHPPPVDHAWGDLSVLAHIGGAAQAAPSCRILGSARDLAYGYCPEHSVVAAAGPVCSQGCKRTKSWFSHNAFLCDALEVNGAAVGACSPTPNGVSSLPPLELEITLVVCPITCKIMQEAPGPA